MTRAGAHRTPPPCGVPGDEHAPGPARPYPCGPRCARHAPWAAAGRSEPQSGPGWPIHQTIDHTRD